MPSTAPLVGESPSSHQPSPKKPQRHRFTATTGPNSPLMDSARAVPSQMGPAGQPSRPPPPRMASPQTQPAVQPTFYTTTPTTPRHTGLPTPSSRASQPQIDDPLPPSVHHDAGGRRLSHTPMRQQQNRRMAGSRGHGTLSSHSFNYPMKQAVEVSSALSSTSLAAPYEDPTGSGGAAGGGQSFNRTGAMVLRRVTAPGGQGQMARPFNTQFGAIRGGRANPPGYSQATAAPNSHVTGGPKRGNGTLGTSLSYGNMIEPLGGELTPHAQASQGFIGPPATQNKRPSQQLTHPSVQFTAQPTTNQRLYPSSRSGQPSGKRTNAEGGRTVSRSLQSLSGMRGLTTT